MMTRDPDTGDGSDGGDESMNVKVCMVTAVAFGMTKNASEAALAPLEKVRRRKKHS